jgi:NADPH:quinone reductase-like Zn-dependent oxidoreductase
MQALHLPGVPAGEDPPFKFPDRLPSPKDLKLADDCALPEPSSKVSERVYLIRVLLTAFTRGELTWQEILEPSRFHAGGAIPGHDVVGIVEKIYSCSSAQEQPKFKVGDKIWALISFDRDGAAAQCTLAHEPEMSLAPTRSASTTLSNHAWDEQLATLPLSALTAHQALFTHGEFYRTADGKPRILILGAAGSVGLPTVQIAKAAGYSVIAHYSSASMNIMTPYISDDDEIIDYKSADYVSITNSFASRSIRPVDFVIDCVGGTTLTDLLQAPTLDNVINSGSKVITIAAPLKAYGPEIATEVEENCARTGIDVKFFIVKPSGAELDMIGKIVNEGKLNGHVHGAKVWKLADAEEAMKTTEARGKSGGGKVVVRVSSDLSSPYDDKWMPKELLEL